MRYEDAMKAVLITGNRIAAPGAGDEVVAPR
jgi:hypothetical protein